MSVEGSQGTPFVPPTAKRGAVKSDEPSPSRKAEVALQPNYALRLAAATALRQGQLGGAQRDLKSAIELYNQQVDTANHVQAAWGAGGLFGASGASLIAAAAMGMLAHPVAIFMVAATGAAGTVLAARSCTKARHAGCKSPSEDGLAQQKKVIDDQRAQVTQLRLDMVALKDAPAKVPASDSELDSRVAAALEEVQGTVVATDADIQAIRIHIQKNGDAKSSEAPTAAPRQAWSAPPADHVVEMPA